MKRNTLKSKVVVITGSSQGIGITTARLMLQQGVKVVINGRDPYRLEAAYEKLSAYGQLHAVVGDMSRWEDVERLIQETLDVFGQIDAIVSNAGLKFEDSLWRTSYETLSKIINVNFLGKVYPVKAGLDALRQSGGSVIFISSLAGIYGLPGAAIYSSAKMALTAMQQGLDLELKNAGIHIGVIHVGFTENDPESGILDGSGVKQDFPDRKLRRQSQETVARAIIDMIIYRKRKRVMSGLGILMDVLAHLAPWTLRLILRKQADKLPQPPEKVLYPLPSYS